MKYLLKIYKIQNIKLKKKWNFIIILNKNHIIKNYWDYHYIFHKYYHKYLKIVLIIYLLQNYLINNLNKLQNNKYNLILMIFKQQMILKIKQINIIIK